jgi:hypothetical protein
MEGMKGKKRKRSVERRGDQAKETEEAARRSRQPVEKLSALPEELHIFPLHFGREISVICLYWLDR